MSEPVQKIVKHTASSRVNLLGETAQTEKTTIVRCGRWNRPRDRPADRRANADQGHKRPNRANLILKGESWPWPKK
jgi:hypothetical protein